ncbi:hypothetical protein CBOM_01608 [Ceraceosorus bombacis]|uniref:2OGFeDO JBP1/TET oxygenase domain-containing protein n=1 Tax=Ceraceosorus bombacis TaxID=401625 RepID=A0A0N7L9G3_9BASI|nr:hypothetical protein CBOM_01608 [Ceraceosorus bombacis]
MKARSGLRTRSHHRLEALLSTQTRSLHIQLVGHIDNLASLSVAQREHLTFERLLERSNNIAAAIQSPHVVWHRVHFPEKIQQRPSPLPIQFEQFKATVGLPPQHSLAPSQTSINVRVTVCHAFSLLDAADAALNDDDDGPASLEMQVKQARRARGMQLKTDTWKKADGRLHFNGGRNQPEYDFLMDRNGIHLYSQQWSEPLLQRHPTTPADELPHCNDAGATNARPCGTRPRRPSNAKSDDTRPSPLSRANKAKSDDACSSPSPSRTWRSSTSPPRTRATNAKPSDSTPPSSSRTREARDLPPHTPATWTANAKPWQLSTEERATQKAFLLKQAQHVDDILAERQRANKATRRRLKQSRSPKAERAHYEAMRKLKAWEAHCEESYRNWMLWARALHLPAKAIERSRGQSFGCMHALLCAPGTSAAAMKEDNYNVEIKDNKETLLPFIYGKEMTSTRKRMASLFALASPRVFELYNNVRLLLLNIAPHRLAAGTSRQVAKEMNRCCAALVAPFSSLAVNMPSDRTALGVHRDKKDAKFGMCMVMPVGAFDGAPLKLPDLGITFHNKPQDLSLFPSALLRHGNGKMQAGVRMSIVCFTQSAILEEHSRLPVVDDFPRWRPLNIVDGGAVRQLS